MARVEVIDAAAQRVLATAPFIHDTTNDIYTANFHDIVEWEQKSYRFEFKDCPFADIDGPAEVVGGGAEISNVSIAGFDMVVTDLQLFIERAVSYSLTADGETRYRIDF